MVVEAAGQDARGVGDVPDSGGTQAALGEHHCGELEEFIPARGGLGVRPGHGFWVIDSGSWMLARH